jgi:hypothetical protein
MTTPAKTGGTLGGNRIPEWYLRKMGLRTSDVGPVVPEDAAWFLEGL